MKNGFTLIELLVVVLIIGILAAVALPQYQKAVMKSRFATLKPLATAVKNAQEIYFEGHGEYATSTEDLDVQVPTDGPAFVQMAVEGNEQFVLVYNQDMPDNAYVKFLAHSPGFANNTYCLVDPDSGSNAVAVCESEGDGNVDTSGILGEMYRLSGNSSAAPAFIDLGGGTCPTKCCDSMGNPVIC